MDIQLNNISKSYDNKPILSNLTLSFKEGRISCLMGASGIGKTTLIHMIMGLTGQDTGEILGCKGKKITAVFQEDRLIEHWNAIKNIKLVCGKEITGEQIRQELHKIGITDDQNQPVRSFSGGMRRRVALIRAILAGFDILILDEPFKGLDEALKKQVAFYLKQNTAGKTVIVVTHEKAEVELLEADLVKLA